MNQERPRPACTTRNYCGQECGVRYDTTLLHDVCGPVVHQKRNVRLRHLLPLETELRKLEFSAIREGYSIS